jgi:hypothetical protein
VSVVRFTAECVRTTVLMHVSHIMSHACLGPLPSFWLVSSPPFGCQVAPPCSNNVIYTQSTVLCRMHSDARNAALGIALDGVQPFKDDCRYSVWPLVLTVYNLPPWVRYKLGATTVLAMIPGHRHANSKLDLDYVMQMVHDDLRALYMHGVTVYDAFQCKPARYATIA